MSEQFHLQEHSALRSEILELTRQQYDIYKYLLIGVFVVMSFALSQAGNLDSISSFFAAWIPLFLTLNIYAFRESYRGGINRAAVYLRELEQKYADADMKGWETQLEIDRESSARGRSVRRRIYLYLIILTSLFGLYYTARYSFGFGLS